MSKRVLNLLWAAALLLSVGDARAFYNPTTGRWLSRDPIGERGGKNQYSFVQGNAVSGTDRLGLWRDPESLYCYCRCLRVEVTFNPGQDQFQWGWHNAGVGDSQNYTRFGNNIHVKWVVLGKPSRCNHYQDESGVWDLIPDSPNQGGIKHASWRSHKTSQEYTDYLGAIFLRGLNDGRWTLNVTKPLDISLRCVSSDGGPTETRPLSIPSPPDEIFFPP